MKTKIVFLASLAALHPLFSQSSAPVPTVTMKGIEFASDAGTFLLAPTGLSMGKADYAGQKPVLTLDGSDTLLAKFPNGAELRMVVSASDKSVSCSFGGVPSGAVGFIFQMLIPMSFAQGGKFSFGSNPMEIFPGEKDKQLIGQATAKQFNLSNPMGAGFSIMATQSYTQLQDNRAFNQPVFDYIYHYPFESHPGETSFNFRFEALDPALAGK